MKIINTDVSQKILQVLAVLSFIKERKPTTERNVKLIRNLAFESVAKDFEVFPDTVRDKCVRQIGLGQIGKFDYLVYLWLKESDESLQKILLNNSKSELERLKIKELFSPDVKKSQFEKTFNMTTTSYRSISQDELDDILKKHQLWLKSNGNEGEQANFERISLKGNELMGLNLEKSDFSSSYLESVDLRNSNLVECNFLGANLKNTNFKNANLKNANFTIANLNGVDFSHAKLEDVSWIGVKYENVKGLSKSIEKIIESQSNLLKTERKDLWKEYSQTKSKTEDDKLHAKIEIASRALTDKPSEIDLLNFSDYAEALTDFITNKNTKKPISIAIDAPWGGGKSTLMGMIKNMIESKSIDKDQSFITIWFNAWKYEKEESLWAALVLNVLKTIRSKYGFFRKIGLWFKLNWKRFDKQLFINDFLYSFLRLLAVFIVGFLFIWIYCLIFKINFLSEYLKYGGYTGLIGLILKTGNELYKKLTGPFNLKVSDYIRKPRYEERIGFIAQFEEDFRIVIETVTKKGKWPLIIFIDDLDRCAAPKPVEVIEAINLLLDSEHCVFILGMDSKSVAASIESKYKNMKDNLEKQNISNEEIRLGQRFLEKIIQVHFHIPKLKEDLLETYINSLMITKEPKKFEAKDKDVSEIEEILESEQREGKSLEDAEKVARKKRPEIKDENIKKAKEEVIAKTFDDSIETKTAIVDAARLLSSNPRKIKRFINNFRLQSFIANRRGLFEDGSINLDVLAKNVTISARWPDIFEWISRDFNLLYAVKDAINIKGKLNDEQIDENEKKEMRSILKQYEIQPFTKICLENEEICDIISELSEIYIEKMRDCIYLTNMTSSETVE